MERQPVDDIGISWRHTIDGDRFKSEGLYECEGDLDSAGVPADLSGRTVLDIGCSDGGHSFLCEGRGATVTGIDSQESPRNEGRNGFTYARDQLGMKASYHRLSLSDFAEQSTERFDHILCFNVLYHVTDPIGFMASIGGLMNDGATLHLKTAVASALPERLQPYVPTGWSLWKRPRFDFVATDYRGDPTCWWFPNPSGVVSLLERVGFRDVNVTDRKIDRLFVTATAPA